MSTSISVISQTTVANNSGADRIHVESARISSESKGASLVQSAAPSVNGAYADMQAVNDRLSQIANTVNTVDTSMQRVNEVIEKMQAEMLAIKKQYPPFPPGSQERVEYLKSFQGLRDQINQMTFPPDNVQARQLMADPQMYPEAGDVTVQLGQGAPDVTIHAQQLHTGPTGLHIPPLDPTNTSDAEVSSALDNLGRAQRDLTVKRHALAQDAAQIGPTIGQGKYFDEADLPVSGSSGTYSEPQAQEKSVETKHMFGEVPMLGIFAQDNRLLQALA